MVELLLKNVAVFLMCRKCVYISIYVYIDVYITCVRDNTKMFVPVP